MDQINTFYYHFPQYITSIALTFFIILVLNIIHNVAIQISKKKKKYNITWRDVLLKQQSTISWVIQGIKDQNTWSTKQ